MIDKTMTIYEVLSKDPNSAAVMMAYGMGCIGCPHAMMESLEMACAGHGVDADAIVEKINAFLSEND